MNNERKKLTLTNGNQRGVHKKAQLVAVTKNHPIDKCVLETNWYDIVQKINVAYVPKLMAPRWHI